MISNYIFIAAGVGLGLLIYFLLSPYVSAPSAARNTVPSPALPSGGKARTAAARRRKCPLCGSGLADGEGVRIRNGSDGSMQLLGCPHCLPPSAGN